MNRFILLVLFLAICSIGYSQTALDSCKLMVRVVNKSKYHIDKLAINKSIFIDSLGSYKSSDFKCIQSIFNSLSYDITFTKKKFLGKPEWAHIISYPIDYIGEKEVSQGLFELFLTIDKVTKDKYEIEFERKKINNGP